MYNNYIFSKKKVKKLILFNFNDFDGENGYTFRP